MGVGLVQTSSSWGCVAKDSGVQLAKYYCRRQKGGFNGNLGNPSGSATETKYKPTDEKIRSKQSLLVFSILASSFWLICKLVALTRGPPLECHSSKQSNDYQQYHHNKTQYTH